MSPPPVARSASEPFAAPPVARPASPPRTRARARWRATRLASSPFTASLAAALASAALVVPLLTAAPARAEPPLTAGLAQARPPGPPPGLGADAHDDVVDLSGRPGAPSAGSGGAQPRSRSSRWMRAPRCLEMPAGPMLVQPCPDGAVVPLPECGAAATLPPLWVRPLPDEVALRWRVAGPAICAPPGGVTPEAVLDEFRRLPLAPSPLVVQPGRGWALVNKPIVVHAQPGPQTLTATILGVTVRVTATPTAYAWDFGDGATLATGDPGRPWPDADLVHAYTRLGTYTIALTTTWSATYTIGDDRTAYVVPGTAATTSTSDLVVQERRSHLVAATCADDPVAPGC